MNYKGGQCRVCGYNRCMSALSFHHLDPNEKDFGIAQACALSWEKVKRELDKCVLLCGNCHAEVHEGVLDLQQHLTKDELERAKAAEDNDANILDFF